MYELLKKLFPICRSITGNGVRTTFEILNEHLPLTISEYPSGSECFDWTIPDEWNVKSATLKDETGKVIASFAENNLHLLGYSIPFKGRLSLDELRPHLYSLPQYPDVIPYLTSYYRRNWGFCLTHRQLEQLRPGMYEVEIDSTLEPGNLTLAESIIPGSNSQEIFFSSYICHPSMANDSISGVVLAVELYRYLAARKNNYYTYRFIFIPETIGAIAYLSRHKRAMRENCYAGMILTCEGDPGPFNYKRTRNGHTIDRIAENILKFSGQKHYIHDFWLPGSDERQYSSPGINLPVATLMRSIYGKFPEYHTSADNLDFVTSAALQESFKMHCQIIEALEGNYRYENLKPDCEPFLSKYGLYDPIGGQKSREAQIFKLLSLLNYSDGNHSLIDIAEKIDVNILELVQLAAVLIEKGLLRKSEKT